MSKRFTETDKWRDSWYRKLTPVQKCLWSYITDNCDQAGVIDIDWELATFQIGSKVKEEDLSGFQKQLYRLECGKWLILGFIKFQYGAPSRACKPHARIFEAMDKHGLTFDEIMNRLSKAIPKAIEGHSIPSPRVEEEDRKKIGGEEDSKTPQPSPDDIYQAYPRKEARKAALAAIERAGKTFSGGMVGLLERTRLYALAVARWPAEDRCFIPHPATWFNRASYEDDPVLWNRGTKQSHDNLSEPVRISKNLLLQNV